MSERITSGPFAGHVRNGYKVIYADPAWTFRTFGSKNGGRSAENHYPCMSIKDICALPVADLAAPDSVLFLWVIDTHLFIAADVIKAWGFEFKTIGFHWPKLNKDRKRFFTGMGFWTRANPELCLLCTKGSPKRIGKNVQRLITGEDEPYVVASVRREHSRKPDEIYDRIESLVEGPYTELFSRTSRPGWADWGFETGKFNPQSRRSLRNLIDDEPRRVRRVQELL